MSNICLFPDTEHPKNELNYVYFDEDNIVATDTKRLIASPNTTPLNNVYLPKSFCEVYSSDITTEYTFLESFIYIPFVLKAEVIF